MDVNMNAVSVNISGRQRMLSQRIAMFALRLASPEYITEQQAVREQLSNLADLMGKAHRGLIYGDASMGLQGNPSQSLQKIYFGEPLFVDRQVCDFISAVRSLISCPASELQANNPYLRTIVTAAGTKLLNALEAVVAQYQKESEEIQALYEQIKAENLRFSTELNISRQLQQMILPKTDELCQNPELEIVGFMEPAEKVGGDYYDVLHQGGRVKIGIGDVTGHGLESGTIMLMVQTTVRALLNANINDPAVFLHALNQTLYGNIQRMATSKSMTLSLIDYDHGKVTVSGQHEMLLLVRQNGKIELFDTIDLGFPIGMEEDIRPFLSESSMYMEAGDLLAVYTDGITEAENSNRELYGLERLCHLLQQHRHLSANEIQNLIIADVRSHIGKHRIYDDITLVILKKK
ncbi:serine phosphatase RsbU, regulator of sigma subunit [Synechococcus sp. PCC 7502]|uniref:PP2C family protein-serine/threonine phosphatase n=1 Tax=Synechococcus sp. PCC 7502 TaxID=1173263 RepID=UPI00029FF774|nr:SpoIIE family protein phosphatase [Synechococcus sp. PCC 7502]AFY74527.1 serine phosphatase RsbU, regulator of sigma subunit [Synechococcus sp. PCC 7502]